MRKYLDQTMAWIMASIFSGGLFAAIYVGTKFLVDHEKRQEDRAVAIEDEPATPEPEPKSRRIIHADDPSHGIGGDAEQEGDKSTAPKTPAQKAPSNNKGH